MKCIVRLVSTAVRWCQAEGRARRIGTAAGRHHVDYYCAVVLQEQRAQAPSPIPCRFASSLYEPENFRGYVLQMFL